MFEVLLTALVAPGPRPAGPTDVELVERFRSGDRRAFDELVRRYQDRVYTLCRRWLDDPQGAEEVAQEVWIALYRSLGQFRGDAQLSTWIFKVTVNHCKNSRLYRNRRAWGRHESLGAPTEDDLPAREIPDAGPGTDAPLRGKQAEQILQAALATLDEDHRQVLLLRDVEDLAYEDIADILDLPRGTVKSRIHRARTELAQALSRRLRPEDLRSP